MMLVALTLGVLPAAASANSAIQHRFLALDNGANRLVLVNQHSATTPAGIVWSVPIPGGGRDIQRIAPDRVLVSHGSGANEIRLGDGSTARAITGFKEVQSAHRAADGTTLLAMPATAGGKGVSVVGVDAAGAIVSTRTMAQLAPGSLRLMRVLANGNILFTSGGAAVEIDPAGKTVFSAVLTGKGYVADRLADGRTVATTGGTCTVLIFDAAGKTLATLGGTAAHPQARLLWFSGQQVLSDGSVVVANWCGHGQTGKGPHAIRFSSDNRILWQWEDHQTASTVTNLLILDP